MKKDYYIIEKNVDKIIRGDHTNFLDPNLCMKVCYRVKGYDYKTYYPYKEAEKVIIYTDKIPKIKLFEILTTEKLSHRMILGSLFGLNVESEMFGDIIIDDNHYYVMVMDCMYDLMVQQYNMVGNNYIRLKEVSFDVLNGYKRNYKKIELIVSSVRIDNVICQLTKMSRSVVKKKFYNDEIILNYEPCHKLNYGLKENDIFSIKKHGKYKFGGIVKNTRKENYIVIVYKYVND